MVPNLILGGGGVGGSPASGISLDRPNLDAGSEENGLTDPNPSRSPNDDGYQYLSGDLDDINELLHAKYKSNQAVPLEQIRDKHKDFKPHSPQTYKAFRAALETLKNSDQSYQSNDPQLGEFFKSSAEILFDVLTDLNPITGVPKDFYRCFVGQEPMTGADLSSGERLFAGGMVAVTILTAGGGKAVQSVIVGLGRWLKVGAKEVKVVTAAATIASEESRLAGTISKQGRAAAEVKAATGATKDVKLEKDSIAIATSNELQAFEAAIKESTDEAGKVKWSSLFKTIKSGDLIKMEKRVN